MIRRKRAVTAQSQPPAHARLRLARRHEGSAAVDVGRAAPEEIAQLLDHHRQARRFAAHHGRLGPVAWTDASCSAPAASRARRATWRRIRTASSAPNTPHEAVIVEGIAEIADVAGAPQVASALRAQVQVRHVGEMKDDILAMKEPVFAVRPRSCSACGRSTSRASPRAGSFAE